MLTLGDLQRKRRSRGHEKLTRKVTAAASPGTKRAEWIPANRAKSLCNPLAEPIYQVPGILFFTFGGGLLIGYCISCNIRQPPLGRISKHEFLYNREGTKKKKRRAMCPPLSLCVPPYDSLEYCVGNSSIPGGGVILRVMR